MRRLAIIPARGGSKRIPRKNLKVFLGRPIISYSIENCIKSNLFDEVMVSTDDEEIARIAEDLGANVPFTRSVENSGDFATTLDVIIEVIQEYEKKGIHFDSICCMYATAPLVQLEDLVDGLHLLESSDFNVVMPVVEFSYPIWRGLQVSKNNTVKMLWPENGAMRSQDLDKVYHDAGQWYWLSGNVTIQKIYSEKTGVIVLDPIHVQDIDTPTDWSLAELKYTLLFDEKSIS